MKCSDVYECIMLFKVYLNRENMHERKDEKILKKILSLNTFYCDPLSLKNISKKNKFFLNLVMIQK